MWLADAAGSRISDNGTASATTAAPAYSSSKAETVDTIEVTTTGAVTGVPRAADFGVQVGSGTAYEAPSGVAVSGAALTLTLQSGTAILSSDDVMVNYTRVSQSVSDLATFAPQDVTNGVFAAPGGVTTSAAPTSVTLSWNPVSGAPSDGKYYAQYRLAADTDWNTAVDRGSVTNHTFTDLSAAMTYDFRVWLANSAGTRISDYGTIDTDTSDPAYMGSRADTVRSVTVTTTGSVTGVPRAADFGVQVGSGTAYEAPSGVAVSGAALTLTLQSGTAILSSDDVMVNYTRVSGSVSDLATFAPQDVTNGVFAAPGGVTTSAAPTSVTLSWNPVSGAPSDGKYYAQYRLAADTDWNTAVDRGSVTNHTFTDLSAAMTYDFRVWLANSAGTRISDYGTIDTDTSDPAYMGSRADTVRSVTVTTTGSVTGVPRAADFGVQVGSGTAYEAPSGVAVSGTAVTLTLQSGTAILSSDDVMVNYTRVSGSVSDLATFAPQNVTNKVFAAPAGITAASAPTSVTLSWDAITGAPTGNKYIVQYKEDTDATWNGTAVTNSTQTSHTFGGLAASTSYNFRVCLADSSVTRIGDHGNVDASTSAPAYSSSRADTVGAITLTTNGSVTGVPRAADFGVKVGSAAYFALAATPTVSGTTIALALPAGTTLSSTDTVKIRYSKTPQSTSDLAAFAEQGVTNRVFAAPGGITATPLPMSVEISWNAVPSAPAGSKYLVQHKPNTSTGWNTVVDKGSGTSHTFDGLSESPTYDFRVYLADGANARISDYATASESPLSESPTLPPTYSSSRADTVDSITITVTSPVTGVPRAQDFGVRIGSAAAFSPAAAPTVSGTTVTLALPPDRAISSADTVTVRYTAAQDSTSDLAAFAASAVTNNVLAAPGGITATPSQSSSSAATTTTSASVSWSAVPGAPPDGKYYVQYREGTSAGWNAAVDRGSATSHTFDGLSASQAHDFRVYLADGSGSRISDYAGTGLPAARPPTPEQPFVLTYSSARADTVDTVTLTATGVVTGVPRASDFGIRVGSDPFFAPASAPVMSYGNTVITLALPAGTAISSADTVKVRYNRTSDSTSDLSTFLERDVSNNVFAAPGGLSTVTAPASVAVSWKAAADAPPDSRWLVQYRPGADADWNAAVDKGHSGTFHIFGGLSQSVLYDFRVYLVSADGKRIGDYGSASQSPRAAAPPLAGEGAAVAGKVFNDTDHSRSPDAGEQGLPDIRVFVHDYVAGTGSPLMTDADGGYAATGIMPGQTALSQIVLPLPSGHLPSGGAHNLFAYTPPLEDGSVATINFPLYHVPDDERGTILFDVYHDLDGDGGRDEGEPGVAGATVYTFELLTYDAIVQVTGASGSTAHAGLVPDVVLAQISYSDPATGALLLPDGFTRITTSNAGAEYVTVAPGSTYTVQIGLAR